MIWAWLTGSVPPSAVAMARSANIGSGVSARSQPPRCWSRCSTVTSASRASAAVLSPSSGATFAVRLSLPSCTSFVTAAEVTGLLRLATRNNEVGWARKEVFPVAVYPRASTSLPLRTTASEACGMLRARMNVLSVSSKDARPVALLPVTFHTSACPLVPAAAGRACAAAPTVAAPASSRSVSLRVSMRIPLHDNPKIVPVAVDLHADTAGAVTRRRRRRSRRGTREPARPRRGP